MNLHSFYDMRFFLQSLMRVTIETNKKIAEKKGKFNF